MFTLDKLSKLSHDLGGASRYLGVTMDRSSRSELLVTVESQKEQIVKYQNKLRDLVAAYKGILKEKEALDATVKALSSQPAKKSTPHAPKPTEDGEKKEKDESGEGEGDDAKVEEQGDGTRQEGAEGTEETDELETLREQLRTVTNSLATMSQEKAKMEANYREEKKVLRQEYSSQLSDYEETVTATRASLKEASEQLQEYKVKVRSLQHDREKEQNDHAIMLREIQKLLNNERTAKEQLEIQLDEAKQILAEKKQNAESNAQDLSEVYEKKMNNLSNELEVLRQRLTEAEEKGNRPSPMLLQLEEDMAGLKAAHRIALQQEQYKSQEAEERLTHISQQSEQRVSQLESKISELSSVVGNYERLRFQDQTAIQKLREKVSQLDMENTALAKAAQGQGPGFEDESEMDIQSIVEKISKLKGALKLANEKADKPLDIEELLNMTNLAADDGGTLHKRCQEDYSVLKEEFERYKLRAQSVLKNKNTKDPSGTKETDQLKSQLAESRERIRHLREEIERQEQAHQEKEKALRGTITAQQEKHKQETSTQTAEFKLKVSELESEIRKHRERTIALLAEKNREIEMLRVPSLDRNDSISGGNYYGSRRQMTSQSSVESEMADSGAGASSGQDILVNELLSRTTLTGGSTGETSLLFFAQEQARKDVEITNLLRQKHSIDASLRELKQNTMLKEEKLLNEIDDLKEEVRKGARDQSRESANLEYLKNVVYHYMISHDVIARQQMLNAISTILQFSPKERDSVEQVIHKGWFGYGQPHSPHGKHHSKHGK